MSVCVSTSVAVSAGGAGGPPESLPGGGARVGPHNLTQMGGGAGWDTRTLLTHCLQAANGTNRQSVCRYTCRTACPPGHLCEAPHPPGDLPPGARCRHPPSHRFNGLLRRQVAAILRSTCSSCLSGGRPPLTPQITLIINSSTNYPKKMFDKSHQ